MLAFLADGESWSSSALALALGASQRTVQRALDALAAAGKVQSFGRGRARRWLTPPVPGFTTTLLLPAPLPSWTRILDEHQGKTMTVTAEILREYGPFPGVDARAWRHVRRPARLVRLRRQAERPRSGERQGAALDRRRRACRHGLRRPAPVPDRRGSHPEDRSEDRPGARHDSRARRRRRLRASPGPKARSGSASIATARSIRSIPRRARSCAPSSPTASSPASPGSTASSGTAPGKATRATCGASIRETGEVLERLEMPAGTGVSGLESDGGDRFFCGGGSSGKVRAVRRPKKA